MSSLLLGVHGINDKATAVNNSGGGVVVEATNNEGSQQDFTVQKKSSSLSRTSDNGFQNNGGCSNSSDIAFTADTASDTNTSLRNNSSDVTTNSNQSIIIKTIDTKNKNNDGTPTFNSKQSANEQGGGINDADDASSSNETVLIAGSPVPKHVLEELTTRQLEDLISEYTDTYIPTTGFNEFVNYREVLINELLYQHKIYTGEIAADYGGDEIIDRYDLDHKERVLRWFQHQNNQVEESSIGVSLLPEIMERVKTECGGAAPSVKGNLSILFSILKESQVFNNRNVSWVELSKLRTKVDQVEEELGDTSGEVNGIGADVNINGECFYWDYCLLYVVIEMWCN